MTSSRPTCTVCLPGRPMHRDNYAGQIDRVGRKIDSDLRSFLASIIINPDEDETEDGLLRRVLLCHAIWELGSHQLGLVYDQQRRRVAMILAMELTDLVLPPRRRRYQKCPDPRRAS
ncbi:hypothetical protein TEQG_05341 [Trichophyton equinum CBS 127.97]|uniref:Uncharacterized protein n=1 Tax=Trichophyton equinum (strain ATCC MYA-4606 / CBS 127.97) TaxID=559882 RepID=F2PWS0_TRIEC|nr:hypothetical protein TEQG_05341 [Trichophyton equinum CBS 127.97]